MLDAQLLSDMLNDAGIDVTLMGAYLSGAAGEIPVDQGPSLWLINSDQDKAARTLIHQWEQQENLYEQPWICPHCTQKLEVQFTQCWQCGHQREEKE